MREIFRGWKRKIGVLALVMACVFMSGWIRSWRTVDTVVLAFNSTSWTVGSKSGVLEIILHRQFGNGRYATEGFSCSGLDRTFWDSEDLPPVAQPVASGGVVYVPMVEETGVPIGVWNYRKTEFCGLIFGVGEEEYYPNNPERGVKIDGHLIALPYGYVAVPLTFISAFLLFTKSRKTTSKKLRGYAPSNS